MPSRRSPGFSPPKWPRLGRRRDAVRAVGGLPPPVVEIPWNWISPPLIRKPTTAITKAQIGRTDGATAYSSASAALVRRYGANTAQIDLDTVILEDPQALANYLTTYEATPRPRQPTLTLNLLDENRTEADRLLILSVGLAQRVRIIHAPDGTPPGALNFTVEGISHAIAVEQRTVTWATAALIGTSATAPGPWFRLGISTLGGPDIVPF